MYLPPTAPMVRDPIIGPKNLPPRWSKTQHVDDTWNDTDTEPLNTSIQSRTHLVSVFKNHPTKNSIAKSRMHKKHQHGTRPSCILRQTKLYQAANTPTKLTTLFLTGLKHPTHWKSFGIGLLLRPKHGHKLSGLYTIMPSPSYKISPIRALNRIYSFNTKPRWWLKYFILRIGVINILSVWGVFEF